VNAYATANGNRLQTAPTIAGAASFDADGALDALSGRIAATHHAADQLEQRLERVLAPALFGGCIDAPPQSSPPSLRALIDGLDAANNRLASLLARIDL
jgi:hypothetical protein